jgi:hypothetical protein
MITYLSNRQSRLSRNTLINQVKLAAIPTSTFSLAPRGLFGALLGLVIFAFFPASSPAQSFNPINMSSEANFTFAGEVSVPGDLQNTIYLPGAPTGSVTLGGVPFDLASNGSGDQAWSAEVAANGGSSQVSVTVPIGLYGATTVYTLINTMWGAAGPNSYASLVFTGTGGATYTYDLISNTNIRNWIPGGPGFGGSTSIITSPTVNVYSGPSSYGNTGGLDMQDITLPSSFADQTLTSVELIDNGNANFQRTVLDGLTVVSVPEPAATTVLCVGFALAFGLRRMRRSVTSA